MTTQRQIERLLSPYRQRRDLMIRGHEVYLVPIHHVVRGFSIYRTGEADRFDIALFVGLSFDPALESPRAVSQVFRYENWLARWTEPNLQRRFERIIQEYALPSLRPLNLGTFTREPAPLRRGPELPLEDAFGLVHMKALLHTAEGDFKAAAASLEILTEIPRGHRVMEPVLSALLDHLQPLILANDRIAVAAMLHTWEAGSIARWELSAHHERTPFPLELQP